MNSSITLSKKCIADPDPRIFVMKCKTSGRMDISQEATHFYPFYTHASVFFWQGYISHRILAHLDPLRHLYVAVNLPGIDNPPPFQLSLICNLLYEPFFGGGDCRLRPPGDAKRHFIGQDRRSHKPFAKITKFASGRQQKLRKQQKCKSFKISQFLLIDSWHFLTDRKGNFAYN